VWGEGEGEEGGGEGEGCRMDGKRARVLAEGRPDLRLSTVGHLRFFSILASRGSLKSTGCRTIGTFRMTRTSIRHHPPPSQSVR